MSTGLAGRRRAFILVALLALVAASCGTGDTADETVTTDPPDTDTVDDGVDAVDDDIGATDEDPGAVADRDCGELDTSVTLNFINAGGAESDAITAGYIEPFTEETGIEVRLDPPNDLGRLQAMVESGQVTHDLFSTESTTLEQAKSLDLFEAIDYDQADFADSLEEALDEYALGFQYYSTIMAWRPDAVEGEGPQNWVEFFDTEQFPGRRALADYPAFTVPIALLGDGVAPEDLYPLDVDRAFAFLEEFADEVAVWWEAGAQPPELLSAGEVDFSMVWSGRIVTVADEENLEYSFNDGLLDLAYIGIPKGAPHYCEALAFLEVVSQPDNQAAAAEVLPYTGPATGVDEFLPQDRLDWFPTSSANLDLQVLQDPRWWFENGEAVQERWEEFKLAR
jgi:putative spermidine/putrescine transport system substrate-binding protein